MAVIDNGEDQMQRATADVGREGTRAAARLASTSATELAGALMNAARTVRAQLDHQRDRGKVSLRRFEDLSGGKQRDLVTLEDKEVVRDLERSLTRRGVTYAIERDTVDGKPQYILHIQGTDANIVADSLERASARIDARRERKYGVPEAAPETPPDERTPDKQEGPAQGRSEAVDDSTRLVEHGAAPYHHKENGSHSYFVTLEHADGSQATVWGVDLERAVKQSGAEVGDVIAVDNVGSVPVTLPNGTETHRNTWNVEVVQSAETLTPTPSHAPEAGEEWAPQPDMATEKSLKSELLAKMEAAEEKHIQDRADAKHTRDAPARNPASPVDAAPKKPEPREPVNVRERIKHRADAARREAPKPNLNAPARGGMKR